MYNISIMLLDYGKGKGKAKSEKSRSFEEQESEDLSWSKEESSYGNFSLGVKPFHYP